jgi:hypothetical protein
MHHTPYGPTEQQAQRMLRQRETLTKRRGIYTRLMQRRLSISVPGFILPPAVIHEIIAMFPPILQKLT